MTTMTEYVRRSSEFVVEGKVDIHFRNDELLGELLTEAEYMRRLAAELTPRTETAIGRFMNVAERPGFEPGVALISATTD